MAGATAQAWHAWRAVAAQADPPLTPVRLRRTGRGGSGLRTAALSGGVALVAALGLASLLVPPPSPVAAAVAASSLPPWRDINRPFQLFALAGSPYARLPMEYAARGQTTGTGREDWLTFGDPGRPGPLLRLVVSRRGAGPPSPADLVVDFARLAATAGHALTRAGLPFSMPTRFGGFDAEELTLRTEALTRACLGFRLQDSGGPIGIIGIACGDPDHPPERSDLACTLDRIDLVAAGEDGTMRSFFTDADRRRNRACGDGPTVIKGAAAAAPSASLARGT